MSNIDVGDTPIRHLYLKSKKYICGKCLEFLMEPHTVIKRGMGQQFFKDLREKRNLAILRKQKVPLLPQKKLKCPNGHNLTVVGFHDITLPKGKVFKP
jgi:hypothetical protein